jgi:hypothetical protein
MSNALAFVLMLSQIKMPFWAVAADKMAFFIGACARQKMGA